MVAAQVCILIKPLPKYLLSHVFWDRFRSAEFEVIRWPRRYHPKGSAGIFADVPLFVTVNRSYRACGEYFAMFHGLMLFFVRCVSCSFVFVVSPALLPSLYFLLFCVRCVSCSFEFHASLTGGKASMIRVPGCASVALRSGSGWFSAISLAGIIFVASFSPCSGYGWLRMRGYS